MSSTQPMGPLSQTLMTLSCMSVILQKHLHASFISSPMSIQNERGFSFYCMFLPDMAIHFMTNRMYNKGKFAVSTRATRGEHAVEVTGSGLSKRDWVTQHQFAVILKLTICGWAASA